MTDAHTHLARTATRHFICEPIQGAVGANDILFFGTHPWDYATWQGVDALRARLLEQPTAGVGEIGLDRLKEKTIPQEIRAVFDAQLQLAAEFHRPVVLHGAKCWGEVVKACQPYKGQIPAFLFHGFSRSGGLIPDIQALNGFISVGPAVLNDHAVNYRRLVCEIPLEMLLVESDATAETATQIPPIEAIAMKVAVLRGLPFPAFVQQVEQNATAFAKYNVNNLRLHFEI